MALLRLLAPIGLLAVASCASTQEGDGSPLSPFAGSRQGLVKQVRADAQSDGTAMPAVFRLFETEGGRVLLAWSMAGMSGGGVFEPDAVAGTWRAPARQVASASCRRLRVLDAKLSVLCIDRTEAWSYALELTADRDSLRAQLFERSTDNGSVRRSYDGRLVRSTKTSFE